MNSTHKHKIGDHLLVKLSGGRIVEGTVKAVIETTNGVRLQVSFGEETPPMLR
jgi:small nuclear ribonucleoprotein (snRNP)-like protein